MTIDALMPGGKPPKLLYTNYFDNTIAYGSYVKNGSMLYTKTLNNYTNRDSCNYGYGNRLFAALNSAPNGVDVRAEFIIASVDTSTGSATATISYSPATVNEVCIIEAYEVVVS